MGEAALVGRTGGPQWWGRIDVFFWWAALVVPRWWISKRPHWCTALVVPH